MKSQRLANGVTNPNNLPLFGHFSRMVAALAVVVCFVPQAAFAQPAQPAPPIVVLDNAPAAPAVRTIADFNPADTTRVRVDYYFGTNPVPAKFQQRAGTSLCRDAFWLQFNAQPLDGDSFTLIYDQGAGNQTLIVEFESPGGGGTQPGASAVPIGPTLDQTIQNFVTSMNALGGGNPVFRGLRSGIITTQVGMFNNSGGCMNIVSLTTSVPTSRLTMGAGAEFPIAYAELHEDFLVRSTSFDSAGNASPQSDPAAGPLPGGFFPKSPSQVILRLRDIDLDAGSVFTSQATLVQLDGRLSVVFNSQLATLTVNTPPANIMVNPGATGLQKEILALADGDFTLDLRLDDTDVGGNPVQDQRNLKVIVRPNLSVPSIFGARPGGQISVSTTGLNNPTFTPVNGGPALSFAGGQITGTAPTGVPNPSIYRYRLQDGSIDGFVSLVVVNVDITQKIDNDGLGVLFTPIPTNVFIPGVNLWAKGPNDNDFVLQPIQGLTPYQVSNLSEGNEACVVYRVGSTDISAESCYQVPVSNPGNPNNPPPPGTPTAPTSVGISSIGTRTATATPRWQQTDIVRVDLEILSGGNVVQNLSKTFPEGLTAVAIEIENLAPETEYVVRARLTDSNSLTSDPTESQPFTTLADSGTQPPPPPPPGGGGNGGGGGGSSSKSFFEKMGLPCYIWTIALQECDQDQKKEHGENVYGRKVYLGEEGRELLTRARNLRDNEVPGPLQGLVKGVYYSTPVKESLMWLGQFKAFRLFMLWGVIKPVLAMPSGLQFPMLCLLGLIYLGLPILAIFLIRRRIKKKRAAAAKEQPMLFEEMRKHEPQSA